MSTAQLPRVIDPLKWQKLMWPDVHFYDRQREIIYSVVNNDETVATAGNMLGKDFVAGFIALFFFCTRHPCRVITTSVKDDHLRVLWGEIMNFVDTAKYPLRSTKGGDLICNHHELKKLIRNRDGTKSECPRSYMRGMVAAEGAALQGHHIPKTGDGIPRTLFMVDEASGVDNSYKKMADTWANREFIFGNPWECENFFKYAVLGDPTGEDRGGDIPRDGEDGYYRKIVHISGEDSPNVRYGKKEEERGLPVTDRILVPGVLSYKEYKKRRKLWDPIRQCVSIDGKFYEGKELKLFPLDWLQRAARIALGLDRFRFGRSIGCDPGEGGAESSWSVVDERGLIEMLNIKTPDTSVITTQTLTLMERFRVRSESVWFDRGGGGKQHADRLRDMGYPVRTVSFGEPASEADKFDTFKKRLIRFKLDEHETKTIHKNRRAEMYWIIRQLIDPLFEAGFGIPAEYTELKRQLLPIPLTYKEGVHYLLPKNKTNQNSKELTLIDLLGCSPDEADSFALACFGLMESQEERPIVGVIDV